MTKEYELMKSLNKMMNYVMPDCREVAELVSFSMDETLPFKKRAGLKMHIMFCKFCNRNYKQLHLIRKLIRERLRSADTIETDSKSRLSEDSRERISMVLKSNDKSQY